MISKFKAFLKERQLSVTSKPTLLAVSGGIDSVVLCHLYYTCKLPFAIAHCNFKLRDDESDADQSFCQQLANDYGVPFFTISFDTQTIAQVQKTSIQVAARYLRYKWLESISDEQQYEHIATAHHLNDKIETFLYNFTKGTGIRGLRSIPVKNEKIIRPLLFASKKEITAYALQHDLDFREDSSNASTKYQRNKIRHEVIPVLKTINPNLEHTSINTFNNLKDLETIYLWAIDHWKREVTKERDQQSYIDLKKLMATPAPSSLLYEIIHPFGFQAEQVEQILSAQTRESGAQFFSGTHRLVKDRDYLIVDLDKTIESQIVEIQHMQDAVDQHEIHLALRWETTSPSVFPTNKNIVYLNSNKLKFPLTLRRWKAGDIFCPLGMGGKRQKLKDFFINNKFSLLDKENVWLLCSGDDICWVVGHRLDERFAAKAGEEKEVLEISLIK